MKLKNIIFFLPIFILNCTIPIFFFYSDKWIIIKNIQNECLYESSISKDGDLLLFYKIKQNAPQDLLFEYGIQKIENNQFIIEIYWSSSDNLEVLKKFKDEIGDYPIINANFELNQGSWIRINNKTKISNYISRIDLYSYKLKNGIVKQSKSLILLPVWNIEIYNKVKYFFNQKINNTGSIIKNKC